MRRSGAESIVPQGQRAGGRRARAALLALSALIAALLPASAQDATWNLNGTGDFNTAANWTPATVPTGTAFFGTSNQNNVSFSAVTTIGGWTFNAGASNYTFTNGQTLTFNGAGIVINGGSATITNNVVLQFVNTSTAGSASIINNLGLQFLNTSTAGSATITNNVALSFNDTSTAGSASIINNFALQFLNTSTAGSATITNNNGLSFDNTSTAGNATITNNAGANLLFLDASIAGNATITNNGGLSFNNTSTAGNAAIANNNNLFFFNTSTAGNAAITNNGGLSFNNASTADNAAITNNAAGNLLFFNTSTAGNATITNNGGFSFNDTSTAGNAAITTNNNLFFFDTSTAGNATIITNNGGATFIEDSASGGQARFITNAGGMVDISLLTGAGTTAGSIEGAGSYFLGSRSLTVGSNNLSTTVSGVIADGGSGGGVSGSLIKVGSGTLTLAGVNTYTGTTTVDAGALVVDGSIASSMLTTVNPGGTLGGNGIVGHTTINGGTLSPGASIGTLTVQGNLVLTAAATYLVEVSGSAADRTNVTGTATLGGTVQAVLLPGSSLTRTYTILHADGGLGGTAFSGVNLSNPNLNASLSYSANDVFLNLTAALGAGTSLNQNQQNVATTINGFFNAGGALPANFVSVFGLTGGNLGNALTLLSGEPATGSQQVAFKLMDQFLALMIDPFVDGRSGVGGAGGPALGFAPDQPDLPEEIALAYSKVMKTPAYKAAPRTFEQRWTAWGAGFGGYNKTSGDPAVVGSHDLIARTFGYAAGLDYHVTRDTVAGVALAGGGTKWDLAQGIGGGRSDAFQAGVYGATRSGPAYLAASLAFANHWMSTDRFAAFGDHLTADFKAQSYGGRVETGYRFGTPVVGVTPYAAVQAQSFRTPGYSEVDASGGGFGLTYNSRTGTDTRTELGSRFDHVAAFNRDAVLTLRGRLAWAHDWVSNPALAAAFQVLPGTNFIVNGATPAKDSALVSAGAELRLVNGVTLLGKFDGEFARGSQTYAGTGTLRVSW